MSRISLVLVWVGALVLALALALRSGDAYSPQDAEKHASEYGGEVREAHGPIPVFLWLCYAGALVFTIVYSIVRWEDVVAMFRMSSM